MGEGENSRNVVIIRLLQVLEKYTDPEHRLSRENLVDILYRDYGMEVGPKAVKANLDLLCEVFDADSMTKDASAVYIVEEDKKYYIDKRLFEPSELRLLIDSVLASKFISERYSKDLIEKLTSLSNVYYKPNVKYVCSVGKWNKMDDKTLFYNIDVINEAIQENKQISFTYKKYGADKKLHNTNAHKGSPYQLILHNQKYYLLFADENWEHVGYVRVVKISNIKICDEKRRDIKTYKGFEYGIDYKKTASLPYMFSDEMKKVVFTADKSVVDDIVDTFGESANIREIDVDRVEVDVFTSPMAMEFWAMQYLNRVKVVSPRELKEKIAQNLKTALKEYEK